MTSLFVLKNSCSIVRIVSLTFLSPYDFLWLILAMTKSYTSSFIIVSSGKKLILLLYAAISKEVVAVAFG